MIAITRRKSPALLLALACMLWPTPPGARAATIHVPGDSPTIQGGIAASSDGDTVLVAPGTYSETIDFLGRRIVVTSSGGPYLTTIDARWSGSVVTFANAEDANSVLSGFTITDGSASLGGGIYCTASPRILDNIIEYNDADAGGGIYCGGFETPWIEENIIRYNEATQRGGGVACEADGAMVTDNVIEENWCGAGWGGGGVFVAFLGSAWIRDNIIHANWSESNGGGISLMESTPTIVNNMLDANSAEDLGGGIFIFDTDIVPVITNNTLFNNQAWDGGGIYINISSMPDTVPITNTIVWSNLATFDPEIADPGLLGAVTYCDVKGGWPGAGNLSADPLFADTTTSDFHLTAPSPCVGAGSNAAPALPDTDFEEDPRIAYGRVDIGADEGYPHLYHVGALVPGQTFDIRLIGFPGVSVWLLYSDTRLDPPASTPYGDLWLDAPLLFPVGPVPSNAYLSLTYPVPTGWQRGEEYFLQALIGSRLSNLDVLRVE